jgi:hypothetical protein
VQVSQNKLDAVLAKELSPSTGHYVPVAGENLLFGRSFLLNLDFEAEAGVRRPRRTATSELNTPLVWSH